MLKTHHCSVLSAAMKSLLTIGFFLYRIWFGW
jgi:hypothetical protein